jgi:uncharacterized repeat protein (TIGR01451 family)
MAMTATRAQSYVSIPDVNFGNWLNSNGFAGNMIGNSGAGWQLDISSAQVLNTTSINCSYSNISNLSGIENFTNLQTLHCSDNNLSYLPYIPSLKDAEFQNNQFAYLPYLPPSLLALNCSGNQITYFSSLPDSLRELSCVNNLLTSIPALPHRLRDFFCMSNQLTTLPVIPTSLEQLYCGYNPITSLPAIPASTSLYNLNCDFDSLTTLPTMPAVVPNLNIYCKNNHITSLPTLPSGLNMIYCQSNLLTSLPALPGTLTILYCPDNQLTSLPPLPASLQQLDCSQNLIHTLPALPASLYSLRCYSDSLTSLPALPNYLSNLFCSGNQLTSLPALPAGLTSLLFGSNQVSSLPYLPTGITSLDCSYNPGLTCLPRIYQNSLTDFYIRGTQISCLPNTVTAQYTDVSIANMPLCDPASGCDFYYNLAGTVHYDTAATCASDSLHPGPFIHNVKVQLKQGGNVIQQFYTFGSGGYSFKTPSLSTYTVDVDTTALPIAVVCPASGAHIVTLSPTDSVEKFESFGMSCSAVDFAVLYIHGTHFRPAFTSQIDISAGDFARMNYNAACGAGVSGTVTTTISGSVHYISPAPGALSPSSVAGNVLTYNLADLETLQQGSLSVIVSTDSAAVAGSQICAAVTVSPSVADVNTANNTLSQCFVVVHSWDPNEKEVYPVASIQSGQWLTYNVQFQNTGTDTAYLVVVRDTLSPNVDASSFEYLASSNPVVIQLFGSAMVFTFPHINLVDSLVSASGSVGWIQYKVRSRSHLPIGTQITNTASIYFDNNPAVVTNTTVNTVSSTAVCGDTTIALSRTICQGDSFLFGYQQLTIAATYRDTLFRADGCDSIQILTLIVNPVSRDTISHSICGGDSFSFGGQNYHSAGYYSQTLSGSNSCDSIVTLHLTLIPIARDTISHSICSGDSFSFGGQSYHSAGYYSQTLSGSNSCDSVVTLHLTLKSIARDTISHSICSGDSFSFGGHSYHSAGYYSQTLSGSNACDSVVTLHLKLNPPPVVNLNWQILLQSYDLTSFGGPDTMWALYCNPITFLMAGGTPIGGHYTGLYISGDTFHFPFVGVQAIDTVYYTFTDTNGCTASIRNTFGITMCGGIGDVAGANTISLHPNPNKGTFTLQTSGSINAEYTISDMLGHLIMQQSITTDDQQIDMHDAADGVYTLTMKGAQPLRFVVMR